MHRGLEKDGLVVVSLSIDEPESKNDALAFLKKVDARIPNFLLVDTDENHEKHHKDFPTNAPPIAHVIDRTGKKVKTFTASASEDDIEKFVRELLKKK